MTASAQVPVERPELHAAIERALREERLVGATWALLRAGETSTGAAGLRDASRGEAMTPATRVQVGSVAKTLLATGVLRLVTEGKLSLDTPIAALLPEVGFQNPWADSQPVRLRHLLDHTSGLEDARLWQVFSLEARPDAPLSVGITRDPSLLRIRTPPGSRLSYSNMGYTLVGMAIEAVVGERYESYLDTHLLQPLGMDSSTFRFVSQSGPQADSRLAMGHFEKGATQAAVPFHLRPPGQFTTTAGDMARFARFLMSDGLIDGSPFIEPGLLRAMGRPSTTEAAAAGLEAGYGLGLTRRDRHGVLGRCHVGTTIGYRANLCLFPEEQKAFFISVNTDSETADYERLNALLVRAIGVDSAKPAPPAGPPPDIAAWEGIYTLVPNRFQSFVYLDLIFNFATVRWDGAKLHVKPFQGAARMLTPAGGMLFRAHDRTTASHVLLRSAGGRRVLSDGLLTYEETSRWRIVTLWLSLAAGALGLGYLVLAGGLRLARRRLKPSDPLFGPFVAVAALLLPIPLLLGQSFLRLGDVTAASVVLALVTGALPLAMALGLWRRFRRGLSAPADFRESIAVLAVLQWTVVLGYWGLMPIRLWVV